MDTFFMVLLILMVIVISSLLTKRRSRRRLEKRLRAAWGNPTVPGLADPDALEDIAGYWRGKRKAEHGEAAADDGGFYVDAITWNDLEMDAVFQALNQTQSNVGEEALYAMLREIGVDNDTLSRRTRWMEALTAEEASRVAIQRSLKKLSKDRYHSAYPFLFHPIGKRPSHGWLYMALAILPFVFLALGFFQPLLFGGVALSFLANVFIFYRTHTVWGVEQTAIRHLAAVLRCARALEKVPVPGMDDLAHELSALCARLKPIARWNALFAMQRSSDMDFMTDYVRIAFQLDMISLTRLAAFIDKNRQQVSRLYELVGEVDACIAVASLRASLPGYTLPEWGGGLRVEAQGLAHPLLAKPVRNNMEWQENSLITGSNASGKSTFVKALAINAIFAQSICTCWAERFVMPRAQVMTSMALRDHLQGGDSYFIVEIKSLKRILSALRDSLPTLCFVDEILRGTNTVERIAASSSLLAYLETQNALCIAATHDIELTSLLKNYRQYHFREDMTPEGMTFSYRLMEGPSATRNAIRLLEQMEFPEEVTRSADQMAAHFDETGKWELA